MTTRSFTIIPQGEFSLRESAMFGFGQRMPAARAGTHVRPVSPAHEFDGVMRLAFCVDGYRTQVGVEVRQDGDGVHCVVHGDGVLAAIHAQVARALSLDHDGRGFADVGRRDPIIGRLQQLAPGLRPPLFYSPFEAAAWAVLSARRPAPQMAEVRRLLSERYGETFELAGELLAALPTPEQLLAIDEFAGVSQEKIDRLHGVARAAIEGLLDVPHLIALGPEQAAAELQQIKGIGPFYSTLIVVRGTGFTDVLATNEPKAIAAIQALYGLPSAPNPRQLEELAENWRPFRTWTLVLIRATAGRTPPT
jgi:DNA-3-methyladenine glycosylase II